MAAEALLERFHEKAQIIRAWGDLRDPDQAGRMIIDCNMNLPLLYWASEQTGDPRFANAAKAHVAQAAKYLIRRGCVDLPHLLYGRANRRTALR